MHRFSMPDDVLSLFPNAAKVRLLHIWMARNPTCMKQIPEMHAIDEAFGEELAITGVSIDGGTAVGAKSEYVAKYLDAEKITYPNVYFTGNIDGLGVVFHFFDKDLPVTIYYDRTGRELGRHHGFVSRNTVIAFIRDLLKRTE
jgi:hypothetical protein